MALIIEDGTGLANAQSLVTATELAAYAALRGVTIPVGVTEQEQLLVKAMDYLGSREAELEGERTHPATQALPWPRIGATAYGQELPNDEVPIQAKNAQLAAALESNGNDLLENTGQNVKREKVDVIETEYFNGGAQSKGSYPAIDSALEPLLRSGSGSWSIPIEASR